MSSLIPTIKLKINEKKYQKIIFKDLKLKLLLGNCYTLVGLNGSGKTTLIEMIAGFDQNYSGKINYSEGKIEDNIFYIPSEFYLPEYLTGYQYFMYLNTVFQMSNNTEKFHQLCEIFDLTEAVNCLIHTYSHGMKKKIQFICSICMEKQICMYDELTSGLDIGTILLIEEIIKIQKVEKIFLIATHDYDFVRNCADESLFILNKTVISSSNNIRKEILELGVFDDKLAKLSNIFSNN